MNHRMDLLKTIGTIVFMVGCIGVGIPADTKVDKNSIIGIWLFDEGISEGVKDASGKVVYSRDFALLAIDL